VEVAAYIGISPTVFDEMVRDGRIPRPKQINARRVWKVRCSTALPSDDDKNPWDEMLSP
jgi:hypothetical protein